MAGDLSRRTVGLSDAHRALIRLLAQRAVEIYLQEIEVEAPAHREEVGR